MSAELNFDELEAAQILANFSQTSYEGKLFTFLKFVSCLFTFLPILNRVAGSTRSSYAGGDSKSSTGGPTARANASGAKSRNVSAKTSQKGFKSFKISIFK